MTSLDVAVGVTLGDFHLDVALAVDRGETVALVGPNGAGKTTLLRAVAGLQPFERGHVVLDGRVLDAPADGVFVPPERRSIGVLFQDHLLFPHLSALENVAFGLRARGAPRREARRRAAEWLERLGLAGHATAKPRQLSGGQAQRVALARALASGPAMVVLDEPLSALDATTRRLTRRDLREHLRAHGGVRVLVTHDPVDAATLADRVVVIEHGRVVQEGTVAELAQRPRSRYVGDFVGVNVLEGDANAGLIRAGGLVLTSAERVDGDVVVAIPPHAVTLSRSRPYGSARNVWQAQVTAVEGFGERVRVQLTSPPSFIAEVTQAAATDLGLARGDDVWVAVKATEVQASAL